MNRYLIAALYVMAGCVVTIPLKVQASPEPLRGDGYRFVVTSTVKAVAVYLDSRDCDGEMLCALPVSGCNLSEVLSCQTDFFFNKRNVSAGKECLVNPSHRIRAPGC